VSTIEIRIDDELVEVEVGPEDLTKFVQNAWDANLQVKAWQRQLAIAKGVIDQLQPEKKAVYDTDFGPVIASRVSGGTTSEVDLKALIANFELTTNEMKLLLESAVIQAKAWEKVDTNLGALVREHTRTKPRKGYINVSVGTKYAPD